MTYIFKFICIFNSFVFFNSYIFIMYREAAEHFLIALNQQAQGRDISELQSTVQMSEAIWSTLRMCVGFMNEPELKELVDNRDLKALNKVFDMTDV